MIMRALRANVSNLLPLLCALYLLLYLDRVNIATAAPLIQTELAFGQCSTGRGAVGLRYTRMRSVS